MLSLIFIIGLCASCQPAEVSPQPGAPSPDFQTTETRQPITLTSTPASEKASEPDSLGLLVFYSDRDGNPEICSMRADGSELARLTNDPAFDDSPAISPDGKRITFLSARNDPNPQFPNLKYEIYVVEIDGENMQRLTNSEAAEDHPAWSPDGDQIVFQVQRDGDFELNLMQPDGSQQRPLAISAADELWPSWGKSTPVLFEKSEQELGLGETCQAALGDLDGDGDLDAVFANPMSNHAGVWLNDGNRFFTDTGQQLTQYGHG